MKSSLLINDQNLNELDTSTVEEKDRVGSIDHPPRFIQILSNGGRPEIDVNTPGNRELFFEFAKSAIKSLDADIQKRTLAYLTSIQGSTLRSFARYFYEGWLKFQQSFQGHNDPSYRSGGLDPDVLHEVLNLKSFSGLRGIDFGCGNGEVLKTLAGLGAHVTGLDLSPFFIQKIRENGFHAQVSAIDQSALDYKEAFSIGPESQAFALATLVLDRLSHPKRFLNNFFGALAPTGTFAIQTLLPIIPRDDGPVENPITYTLPENQIVLGQNIEEDQIKLKELLASLSGGEIKVKPLSYSVTSLDGIQKYTLWSFAGRKASR